MKSNPSKATDAPIRITQLIPNLLTIAAICAGLTAIRFGYEGDYERAVQLILVAGVLDGLDGRIARLIGCPSAVGAELDSLADFLNFGVAPVLVLHSWALQDFRSAGWIAVLCYAICCVLRLARFNVNNRIENDEDDDDQDFFVGIPSPAGAVLVMLPMVVSFALSDLPLLHPAFVAIHICVIGLLMISRIPTYSFKTFSIDRGNVKFVLLGAILLGAALLTYLWATLSLISIAYIGTIIWTATSAKKKAKG